ncbi:hypothetical protein [Streptomyces sp. NPDC094032]|uniref:hypothetical protein n=1 Tax=Streptomyces sp. NPDC094032 TaxID=3155308 RepID=UPI00332B19C4
MTLLPQAAAPGVAETAAELAARAAELYDLTAVPESWSAAAVEDAIDAVETVLIALQSSHRHAGPHVMWMGFSLTDLRSALGLPPRVKVLLPGTGFTKGPSKAGSDILGAGDPAGGAVSS